MLTRRQLLKGFAATAALPLIGAGAPSNIVNSYPIYLDPDTFHAYRMLEPTKIVYDTITHNDKSARVIKCYDGLAVDCETGVIARLVV